MATATADLTTNTAAAAAAATISSSSTDANVAALTSMSSFNVNINKNFVRKFTIFYVLSCFGLFYPRDRKRKFITTEENITELTVKPMLMLRNKQNDNFDYEWDTGFEANNDSDIEECRKLTIITRFWRVGYCLNTTTTICVVYR